MFKQTKVSTWEQFEWWIGVLLMIILISGSINLWGEYSVKKVSSANPITSVASIPQRVMIPKIKLVSQLVMQPIVNQEWIISETEVNYLVGSGSLNGGNLVLYAHKKPNLFGRLHELKLDDLITITGSGEATGYYKVAKSYSTNATDLSILNSTNQSILTMFTCDGWNDKKRWVVIANKIEQEEKAI